MLHEDSVVIGKFCCTTIYKNWKTSYDQGNDWCSKDVIPFGLSFGNRNYLQGINLIGLRRKKI